MLKCRLEFLLIFVSISRNNGKQESDTGKVIFVNLIHRHGDRTPFFFYPGDPLNNISYWPEGIGQLTNKGKNRMFELGQWLRKRYDKLLTDLYNASLVYAQSTDKDRTLMSAECVLAGMFPPRGIQEWSEDVAWQPIPVHTIPLNMDRVIVLYPEDPCPAYSEEINRVFTSDEEIKQWNKTYSTMFQEITKHIRMNLSLLNVFKLSDNLLVKHLNNLTLPKWSRDFFPEPLRQADVDSHKILTLTPKLIRLSTGLLLKNMIQNMVDKVGKKSPKNVHLYSAHDVTIFNLLVALGACNDIMPPYASCLMMELRAGSSGKHHVSIYFRNSTSEEPYLLTVKGCTPQCPLNKFIHIVQPFIPEDWNQECHATGGQASHLTIVFITLVVVVLVGLIAGAVTYCVLRQRSLI